MEVKEHKKDARRFSSSALERGPDWIFLYFIHLLYFLNLMSLQNKKGRQEGASCRPNNLTPSDAGLCDVGGLGTFRALNDLKFDGISFLQRSIPVSSDCRIMDENVWAVIAPDEAVPFRIVKPLHGSLHFAFPPDRDLEIWHPGARRLDLTP